LWVDASADIFRSMVQGRMLSFSSLPNFDISKEEFAGDNTAGKCFLPAAVDFPDDCVGIVLSHLPLEDYLNFRLVSKLHNAELRSCFKELFPAIAFALEVLNSEKSSLLEGRTEEEVSREFKNREKRVDEAMAKVREALEIEEEGAFMLAVKALVEKYEAGVVNLIVSYSRSKAWEMALLHYASENGFLDVVVYLVEKLGANFELEVRRVNPMQRHDGEDLFTPLHLSLMGERFVVSRYLMSCGAVVDDRITKPFVTLGGCGLGVSTILEIVEKSDPGFAAELRQMIERK
jgi:hypothetical protein